MSLVLLISGTGTGLGKTAVSEVLCQYFQEKNLKVAYYKPLVCGTREENPGLYDDEYVAQRVPGLYTSNTYRLKTPCSPHLAFEKENKTFNPEIIQRELERLCSLFSVVVVEGAGGAAVPLNREGLTLADLWARLPGKIVVVTSPGLGTLNHTLMTVEYFQKAGKQVDYLFFSEAGPPQTSKDADQLYSDLAADNQLFLKQATGLEILGFLPYQPQLNFNPQLNQQALDNLLINSGKSDVLLESFPQGGDKTRIDLMGKGIRDSHEPISLKISEKFNALHASHSFRTLSTVEGFKKSLLQKDGKLYTYLTGNDYLGLSSHPEVIAAGHRALDIWGTGSKASRLLGGSLRIHQELEENLACYHGYNRALVMGPGFSANTGIMKALDGLFKGFISDKWVHASMVDGMRESKQGYLRFAHNNSDHLEQLLSNQKYPEQTLVAVETLYSMDGDFAPLEALARLQDRYGFWIYIDEAHSLGGYPHLNIYLQKFNSQKTMILGTFGKALGGYGSFLCAPDKILDYLIQNCRSLIYSTALPPVMAASATAALKWVQTDLSLVERLQQVLARMEQIRQNLTAAGFTLSLGSPGLPIQSHIVPVYIGKNSLALQAAQILESKGIWAGAVRPPTVPPGTARLRVSLHINLQEQEWKNLEEALGEVARMLLMQG